MWTAVPRIVVSICWAAALPSREAGREVDQGPGAGVGPDGPLRQWQPLRREQVLDVGDDPGDSRDTRVVRFEAEAAGFLLPRVRGLGCGIARRWPEGHVHHLVPDPEAHLIGGRAGVHGGRAHVRGTIKGVARAARVAHSFVYEYGLWPLYEAGFAVPRFGTC